MVLLHTPLVINTSYAPPTKFNCNNAQTPFPPWESKCQELHSLIPKSPAAGLGMVLNETRWSSLDHLRIRLLLDYLGVRITLPWSQHQTHGPLNISGWAEGNPVVWSGGSRELGTLFPPCTQIGLLNNSGADYLCVKPEDCLYHIVIYKHLVAWKSNILITCDCWKRILLCGSTPQARRHTAMLLMFFLSMMGACGKVSECRSTMLYSTLLHRSCSCTQWRMAPR